MYFNLSILYEFNKFREEKGSQNSSSGVSECYTETHMKDEEVEVNKKITTLVNLLKIALIRNNPIS